jgi:hypothetical protein
MEEIGGQWEDALEFRQRHLLKAIKNRSLF